MLLETSPTFWLAQCQECPTTESKIEGHSEEAQHKEQLHFAVIQPQTLRFFDEPQTCHDPKAIKARTNFPARKTSSLNDEGP